MKKQKGKKSNAQLIIGALMTGKSLGSRNISDMVSEIAGKEIKVQDVASMLSKISNTKKSDLGFFIKRVKEGNSFTYNMVDEILELSEEQAYDLTLKIGKDRYTLDEALEDFPGLCQYVPGASPKAKPQPKKSQTKKAVVKKAPQKPAPKVAQATANPVSDALNVEALVAGIIQKVTEELGNMDLRVKVSLNVEGVED